MKVYQIRMKLYLLEDISAENIQIKVTDFIDRAFLKERSLSILHEINTYKNYCYDLPYPVEPDKIYKKGHIYTLTVRTIDERMADFFQHICINTYTRYIKAGRRVRRSRSTFRSGWRSLPRGSRRRICS